MVAATETVLGVFAHVDTTVRALEQLRAKGYHDLTVYTPVPVHEIEDVLDRDRPVSRVRLFTLIGGLTGTVSGFLLTIWSAVSRPSSAWWCWAGCRASRRARRSTRGSPTTASAWPSTARRAVAARCARSSGAPARRKCAREVRLHPLPVAGRRGGRPDGRRRRGALERQHDPDAPHRARRASVPDARGRRAARERPDHPQGAAGRRGEGTEPGEDLGIVGDDRARALHDLLHALARLHRDGGRGDAGVRRGAVQRGGVLIKRGPGNRGPSECGTTHEATSGMSSRSEERRVGKECRSRWSPYH